MTGVPTDGTTKEALPRTSTAGRIALPAALIGVGLGGLVYGIVFHQLLQWHHLLSSVETSRIEVGDQPVDTVPGLESNLYWDGIFQVGALTFLLVGLAMVVAISAEARRPFRVQEFWGWALIGSGALVVIEAIINHHLLGIHHVRPGGNEVWWDLGWLLGGVILVVAGWLLRGYGASARTGPSAIAGTAMDRRNGQERRVILTARQPLADERRSGVDRRSPVAVRQP